MPRKTTKGKQFEILFNKASEAFANEYYVETISVIYALMEERSYTLLDMLSISYSKKDKLYGCMEKLKTAIRKKTLTITPGKISIDTLYALLDNDFLKADSTNKSLYSRVDDWRKKRNDTIHDLAKGNIAYSDLKDFASDGIQLFRDFSATIMRLKKRI